MDVETPLEANAQFAEAGKPGVRTLDHPAVSSQPFLAFYAAPGNARRDPSLFQVLPAAGKVVALVRMQFVRAFAGRPFRPGTAGIASTVRSNAIESCRLAPVTVIARGTPRASTTRCRFVPSLPRSVGLGPVSWPPGAGNAGRIQACPSPVNLVMLTQAAKHRQMQLVPYARGLPVSQASPASHAATETEFLRQVFPGDTRVQDVQDVAQCSPVVNRASATAFG